MKRCTCSYHNHAEEMTPREAIARALCKRHIRNDYMDMSAAIDKHWRDPQYTEDADAAILALELMKG